MCDRFGNKGHSLYFSADLRQCESEVVAQKATCADYTVPKRTCQVFSVTLGKFEELFSGCLKAQSAKTNLSSLLFVTR
tara:strand:+ start:188 stop:421 length:234 start_codon:yes stop_codon:yes gene_type:complete